MVLDAGGSEEPAVASELGADRADIEGGGVVDVRESVVTGGELVVGVIDRVGGSVVDIRGSLLVHGGGLESFSSVSVRFSCSFPMVW